MRRKCLLSAVALTALMLVGVVFAPPTITQLTNNTAYDGDPSISGDGSKIAFESDVGGDDEIFLWKEEIVPPPLFGLSPTIIAIIIVVVIASITTTLYLIIRRRRQSK